MLTRGCPDEGVPESQPIALYPIKRTARHGMRKGYDKSHFYQIRDDSNRTLVRHLKRLAWVGGNTIELMEYLHTQGETPLTR